MVQQRLLDIAIREFGEKGLEGASTRGIASAAGTAMSSITYHYGGKEGLYLAAAEHVATQMVEKFKGDIDARIPSEPAAARAEIRHLLGGLVDQLSNDMNAGWSLFISREQLNPTEAFNRIYEGAMGPAIGRIVELVCVAAGIQDRGVARVASFTMFGQIIALKSLRSTMLRMMEHETMDEALIAMIRVRILANADAIIDRLIAERQEAA